MQAIILAGGEGIKLRPLTLSMPKPLLPLINKPLIDYIILILKHAGITEIIITADYLSEQLIYYFNKNNFGIPIKIQKITKYNGTANILTSIKEQLKEEFLVLNGDIIFDLYLPDVIKYFQENNAKLGLVVRKEKDILGKSALLVKNNRLEKLIPADSTDPNKFSDAWIYYIKKELLSYVEAKKEFDIHINLIDCALKKQEKISVVESKGFWAVIGRVHPYIAANFWVLQNIGSPNYVGAKSKIHKTAKMIEPYFIDEECEVGENVELGPNVILCKSVKIEAGTKLNNAIIHRRTKIGQKCVLENCVVSDNNTIGENAKIGQLAIVAPNCEIGANTKIFDGARVGPNLTIAENSKIQDFIFPTLPQLKAKKKTPDGLTPTELEIYLNLQTAGEQTLASLANLVNISQAELQQHLDSLISKKLIVVYGGETKMVGLVG